MRPLLLAGLLGLGALPAVSLDREALLHDSRDPLFRAPGGAVPAGTPVTLRFRTAFNDASSVTLFTWDESSRRATRHSLARAHENGRFDLWEVVLPAPAGIAASRYRFVVRGGDDVVFYEDDPPRAGHEPDGGSGRAYDRSPDRGWTIVWHDPSFTTPAWAQGAVVYQVFPDRFANGDTANDPRATDPAVHGKPVLPRGWHERPEGSCRYYTSFCCTEDPRQRDFFGGDLEGLRQKLPMLADLGVDALYLNPIFSSATNHKYDTRDYTRIDPAFGDEDAFRRLAAEASRLGVRLILDGVFNHASSDSVYFDKYGRYPAVGADEAEDSTWAPWFFFDGPWPDGHRKWFGVDTLPVLAESEPVKWFFWGDDGVAHRWLAAGASGWRLDAMEQKSHGFWREFRSAVRARSPEAFIVGEFWNDATPWLLGDQLDSVMNYRFRDALIGFVNGETVDANGRIADLPPSSFVSVLQAWQEQYPKATHHVLMNLVDSHDTERILWTLAPGRDRPDEKEQGPGYEAAIRKLKLLATLQMTLPGAPTVYYGDEVGITGDTDPDNRRPYPWGQERTDLRDHYRSVMRLRRQYPCLKTGDWTVLHTDDAAGTLAYVRHDDRCSVLVAANRSDVERVVKVVDGPEVRLGPREAAVVSGRWKPPAGGGADLAGWQPVPARCGVPGGRVAGGGRPPVAPVVAWSSPAAVALAWPSSACPASCDVLRRVPGGDWTTAGVAAAAFVDTDVLRGDVYEYALRGDEIGPASESVVVEPSRVSVHLSVLVPDAGDGTVFVAGNFQGWVAHTTPMARQPDGRWTHTLQAPQGERLEYKYTLGTWDVIEKGAAMEELPFRLVVVEPDASGAQRIEDRVTRWRDSDPCAKTPEKSP